MHKWIILAVIVVLALSLLVVNRRERFSGYCADPNLAPGSYAHPHQFSYANTRERPLRKYDDQPLADPQWAWQNPKSCPYVR